MVAAARRLYQGKVAARIVARESFNNPAPRHEGVVVAPRPLRRVEAGVGYCGEYEKQCSCHAGCRIDGSMV